MDLDLSLSTFEPVLKALAAAGLPTLEQTLTQVVATTVAGPFGGLITTAINPLWTQVNHALGLDAATPPAETAKVIAADPASARDKLAAVQEEHAWMLDMFKAQSSADLAVLQERNRTDLAGDAAQDAINTEAAKSATFFVYGYRPAIVWGLGACLVGYVAAPLLGWFIRGTSGHDWGTPPELPWYGLVVICALLGIVAALRSFDKAKGTAALPPAAPAAAPAKRGR